MIYLIKFLVLLFATLVLVISVGDFIDSHSKGDTELSYVLTAIVLNYLAWKDIAKENEGENK